MTSFCTAQNFERKIDIKMTCSEIYQIEISELEVIIIFWKIFDVIERWYIVFVPHCLHLKKWIWEDTLSRESGVGPNRIWNKMGEQSKIYENITYLPLPCFKIKLNINLPNAPDHPCLHLYVWQNKCWILFEYYRPTLYNNDLYHFHNIA